MLKNIISTEQVEVKAWEALEEHESQEITPLVDTSASGRKRPWNEKAKGKERIAHAFDMLGLHYRADKILGCGAWLKFLKCSVSPMEHPKKLVSARFCKDKFCDMCNWRRSLKYIQQMDRLLTAVNERQKGLGWVFLTLTVRNVFCRAEGYPETNELKEKLDDMFEAWNLFAKDRQFKKRVVGWIRALEVTVNNDRNSEWYGSYHPHFHVLLAVDKKRYFGKHADLYFDQGDWVELWKRCAKLDYDPVVDVRNVKKVRSFEEMSEVSAEKLDKIKSPVLEVAKYPLKMAEVFKDAKYQRLRNGKKRVVKLWDTDDYTMKKRLWDLQIALHRRRMLGFGGLIKQVRKELNQQDLEAKNADLIYNEEGHDADVCQCPTCGAIRRIWKYRLTKDGYIHGAE